jgi:chromosome segregation ATPase
MENTQVSTTNSNQSFKGFVIGAAVAIALLAGATGYLFWQLNEVRDQVASASQNFSDEMSTVRETSALDTGTTRKEMEDLRQQLSATLETAQSSVGQAKVEAKKHAEKLAQSLAKKQDEQRDQIAQRISEIEEEASSRIEQVNSDVGSVKEEIATSRRELEDVVTDFRQVRGDLGVMSGRIATNGEELAVLKQLGERNYFEFDVTKSKTPIRVGEISILLRNTVSKDNRFAIDIYADDKRIEKKFKTVNEPIQFYIGGRGGQPYEVVVNQVKKDRIVGYLAAPKVERAAAR